MIRQYKKQFFALGALVIVCIFSIPFIANVQALDNVTYLKIGGIVYDATDPSTIFIWCKVEIREAQTDRLLNWGYTDNNGYYYLEAYVIGELQFKVVANPLELEGYQKTTRYLNWGTYTLNLGLYPKISPPGPPGPQPPGDIN